ncbi:hypothetical protein J6590_052802 [Homalodisca vitripennis]|nr:hypothetical protein J6590_052802 [Homalodisca vitripennis]
MVFTHLRIKGPGFYRGERLWRVRISLIISSGVHLEPGAYPTRGQSPDAAASPLPQSRSLSSTNGVDNNVASPFISTPTTPSITTTLVLKQHKTGQTLTIRCNMCGGPSPVPPSPGAQTDAVAPNFV